MNNASTPRTWHDLLGEAARELSDLDEVREHGEWFTGGGCRALGAVIDHGGDTYHLMLTDNVDAHVPDESATTAALGVYAAGAEYDPDAGNWALAYGVDRANLEDVAAVLMALVHDDRVSEIVLDPQHWLLDVAKLRASRND